MQKSFPRWRDFTALSMLTMVLFIVAMRLVLTKWTPNLGLAEVAVFWGILLGFIFAHSSFKKFGIFILTLGYSLFFIPWQITTILKDELYSGSEKLIEISARLRLTQELYNTQQAVDDPLIFILLAMLLFWIVGIHSGYAFLRKKNSLVALFPSTIIILAIQYYDNRGASSLWILGFYFFFLLLFLARLDFLENKKRWEDKKIFIIPDEKLDINIITFIAIASLLLLAWNIPSTRTEWRAVSTWWQNLPINNNSNIDNLFSAVDNPNPSAGGGVFYGAELSLGNRSYQGEKEIAIIHVPKMENRPPRFYWRVRSYDTYINGSWKNSNQEDFIDISAQTALPIPFFPRSELIAITFTNQAEGLTNLLTSQQPILLDIDTEALRTELSEDELDLILLRAKEPLPEDERYTLRAALNAPTVKELREASTEYPKWVLARYLQLPANLPESIHALASELSANKETPYDIVKSVTNHLRGKIEYSTEVPPPPQGRDALEWFLFTHQKGYCNYSASAEVVLLRSAGIPARLVVGFAQGELNEMGNFVVRKENSHAWAEVYFPEIGWVEFEPTLNQARLLRPTGEEITEEEEDLFNLKELREDFQEEANIPLPEEDAGIEALDSFEGRVKIEARKFLFWGMIIVLTVALFFTLWYFNREQVWVTRALRSVIQVYEKNNREVPIWIIRWLAWRETNPIARAFYSVNASLRSLKAEVPAHFTPEERVNLLLNLMPDMKEEIAALLFEHQKEFYTPNEGNLEIALKASRAIHWQTLKRKFKRENYG